MRVWAWLRARVDILLLAVLAYVPALASSPGRMPADTKFPLYGNPSGLLADARWSYDPRLFGGWVTHQVVGYLWPTGPWYWFFDRLGVPDWVAHRLWIGTIMFAAGAGTWLLARHLGLGRGPAIAAALAYQCSPYLIPYISRTSVMLLPWAGLPWLIVLVRRAVARGGWRDPALCALLLVTVGAVNVTATAMLVPGALLWLVHEGFDGGVAWRRLAGTAGRIALWTAPACAWWFVAVSVQGRYGADVLTYSESFEAVASTAAGGEVLRGHGYWLSYLTLPVPSTSMERVYEHSPALVAIGFVLLVLSAAGLAFVRWRPRRYAVWIVLTGLLLAVAAHTPGSRSLVAKVLSDNSDNSLVLGLRSATRAVPLVALGLALGLGSCVAVLGALTRRTVIVSTVVGALAVANLPALWTFGFVDPENDRVDPVPSAWVDVGRALDAKGDAYRTLQVPGADFSAHTWGKTVDPVLMGLFESPAALPRPDPSRQPRAGGHGLRPRRPHPRWRARTGGDRAGRAPARGRHARRPARLGRRALSHAPTGNACD